MNGGCSPSRSSMSSSTNEISLERIANSKQTTAGEMITTNIRLQSDARDPPDQLKNSRKTSEKREGLLVPDPLKEYSCTRVNEQATIATSFLNDEKESRGKRAEPSPRLSDSCRRESESQDPSECSRVHSTLTHSVVKTPSFENRVESEKIKCDGSSNVQKRVEEPRRKKKRHFLHRFKKKKQKEKKVEWQGSIQIIPILRVLDSDDDKDPHVASERSNVKQVCDEKSELDEDGSGNSKMEFSTGDLSDLSFPTVGDADLEERLSMVLGGKLGMKSKNKAWKHNSFRNLVANITNCSEKKRNGESVLQVDMSSPRHEADGDLLCHKENASEAIVPNVSKSFCESEQSTTRNSGDHPTDTQSKSERGTVKVMLAPSEAVSQNNESQTIRENHGTPREVSSPSVEETSSNDLEKREKSILLESSCAESFASNKGDCTDEVQVEVTSTEANVELTAKFVSEDDHAASVMDCDCVAGLADALNFVTTPIFEYAFGDDYTDTNSKKKSMSLEEEKNHLLEILLSEFASSKQKKKAANRLMDFEVDEEFLERVNSCFEASCDASIDSTYLPDHVDSTVSTTLPHQDTDTSESIIAPENQSQQIPCDRYTPMVTVNEIDTESLCGEGMNESLSTKKSIPDDIQLTEESLSNIRSVLSTEKCDSISLATFQSKSSAKTQNDIGPGELAVLEKHANILGVDVKVLIDARMKATNQIQEK